MTIIQSKLNTRSTEFAANTAAMAARVDDLRSTLDVIARGGGIAACERHVGRGKLLVRQRIRALLDPGSPFLEFSALAAHQVYGEDVPAAGIITGIGSVIAVLMGIGAVFGAVNTMYNAVATRTREIATLRALGFRGSSVVISVMVESALLAVIGGGLAYAAFHGYQTATMNFQTFSQVAFAFTVTPALLVQGAIYALIMGLIGGFFPAIRAARMPIVTALREL